MRLSQAGTGFGAMVAEGSGVQVTSEVDALLAAIYRLALARPSYHSPGTHLWRPAPRLYGCEIRGLVVAEPYTGIGADPVSGRDRVARAQRAVHREID